MTSGSLEPRFSTSAGNPRTVRDRLTHRRVVDAARIVWFVVAALTMALALVGEPANYQYHLDLKQYDYPAVVRANLAQTGLNVHAYAAYLLALSIAFTIACFVVGAIIGLRRSDRPMSLFVSSTLILIGAVFFHAIDALADQVPLLKPFNAVLSWLTFVSAMLLLLIFPDGRFVPRWTRWLAPLTVAWWFLPVPNTWWGPLDEGFEALMLAVGCCAQIYRYRRITDPAERRQLRLVAVGLALGLSAWLLVLLLSNIVPALAPGTVGYMIAATIGTVCLLCIPASIGIAVLRYHLWDIELIINRTLVYAPLTALLAGLFGGLLYLFEQLFLLYTGGTSGRSVGAAMLAAIVVGAALTPLKNGIQAVVDRHVKVPAHPTSAVRGAAGSDPTLDSLQSEITALRAELASRVAVDQELHQLSEKIELLERRASAGSSTARADDSATIGPKS